MNSQEDIQVETTGETVGEAKWLALRELEKIRPGIDKSAVRFQVLSEGERGLLGIGYSPARVIATIDPTTAGEPAAAPPDGESVEAGRLRDLLERISTEIGARCRVEITEDEETILARCSGPDLGLLIGKHGQMIDAVQYLANAIIYRGEEVRKAIIVDAAGYRDRRRTALDALAVRNAERALASGEPVELEPMTAVERKVVHECLKAFAGVETRSEGTEPNRFVVIEPAESPGDGRPAE